jgi:hypothetical protein
MPMRILLPLLAFLPLACGKEEAKPTPGKTAYLPFPDAERFVIRTDPGAAISVNETKEKGPGEEVTVVGRLNKIVKGFLTFNLVDTSVEYCGEATGEKCCDTPWDYC